MILATASTSNFCFQTLAPSRDLANEQLLAAFEAHRAEYRNADPDFMRDLIAYGEINYAEISVGTTLRDNEPIHQR